jgi:hypothetical protein
MFGDEDHSHSALALLTLLNTIVLIGLIYMLLAAGVIDLRDAPIVGGIMPGGLVSRASRGTAAAAAETPSSLLTPGPRATATRAAVASGSPAPQFGFKGGDAVLARRGAEFRSSSDLKQDSFCTLTDDTPGSILKQDPAKATDRSGRPRSVYPVEVRDATCQGGAKMADLKGWVSEEFLRIP